MSESGLLRPPQECRGTAVCSARSDDCAEAEALAKGLKQKPE